MCVRVAVYIRARVMFRKGTTERGVKKRRAYRCQFLLPPWREIVPAYTASYSATPTHTVAATPTHTVAALVHSVLK